LIADLFIDLPSKVCPPSPHPLALLDTSVFPHLPLFSLLTPLSYHATWTDIRHRRENCPTTTAPSNYPSLSRLSRFNPPPLLAAIVPSDTAPQDKLERHEYPTLSTVESDIKRMVSNAKQYNDDKSTVYQDAERIRKALSNFMTKHNPAYKDPNYVAVPTPIPGHNDDATASSAPSTREPSEQPRKITISLKANRDRKSSAAPPAASSPAIVQDDSDPADFTGKTFQQAQEHIINGLISYTDQGSVAPAMNIPNTANIEAGSRSSSPSSHYLPDH
jgi:hypothetical protein